jgi:hypothetical protein
MDSKYYALLAPPGVPEPWLGVLPSRDSYVIGIGESAEAVDAPRLETEWSGKKVTVVKDDPSIRVHYCGGLYFVGSSQARPVHLAARRNWFLRYKHILERYLVKPLSTLVHFYERRPWDDLLCTMRSTRVGPFPFPKDADWPRCGRCRERMAFIGTLDFRDYHRVGDLMHLPKGSLVLHGCDKCSIPCVDVKSTSLTWITSDMPLELRAEGEQNDDTIEIGRPFLTIEFPTAAFYAADLSNDADFLEEWGIYQYFTCPLNKVGGHLHWIQDDDEPPRDRNGNPMQYVGQVLGSSDVEFADSGTLYVFFSDETRETKTILQYY